MIDPQLEHIVHPSAVVLHEHRGALLRFYNSHPSGFSLKSQKVFNQLSTLFGFMARCRFSIHLSLSEAERQAKHFVPELVVTYRAQNE